VPSWAEPLDGGAWALRLHETLGRRGRITTATAAGWNVAPADVRGRSLAASPADSAIEVRPYGLLTLRFEKNAG